MKVTNTKSATQNRIKMLIVGESGAGKTTLAGTIDEPTLVISAEAGLLSLQDKDIDVIDISQDDNGNMIPEEKRIDRLKEAYQFLITEEARGKYSWVVIDSITEINENLLAALNKKYPDKKDTMKMFSDNAKIMKGIIKNFRDLPCLNVVFTCLISVNQNEDGMLVKQPMVTGKLKDNITAYFDEVFMLYTTPNEDKDRPDHRRLLTGAANNIPFTKDRSGKLKLVEEANLQKIINKIKGDK